jgi:hypothetical protein
MAKKKTRWLIVSQEKKGTGGDKDHGKKLFIQQLMRQ